MDEIKKEKPEVKLDAPKLQVMLETINSMISEYDQADRAEAKLNRKPEDKDEDEDKDKDKDKQEEGANNTARMQKMLNSVINVFGEDLSTEQTSEEDDKVEENASNTLDTSKVQELLDAINVMAALDLPAEESDDEDEAKKLGEEVKDAMGELLKKVDKFEHRKKKCSK